MHKSKKIFACCFVTFTITILTGFVLFSAILKFVVHDQTALRKRNQMRDFYEKIPFPLEFCIYFFNVTNVWEVQKGLKPNLNEVGPYCYDAYKEKIEVFDDKNDDSLTYTPHEIYFFNKELTSPLSEDDYVTIIHPLIVGIVNSVASNSPTLLPVVNKAINALFANPKSIYLTEKVRNILFDGFVVNCTSKGFAAKAVCGQLKSSSENLRETKKNNIYVYSLLGSLNGTLPRRIKVLRGIKNSADLGRVVEVNGQKILDIWATKECNKFNGTDGWIFPSHITKENGVRIFAIDICRNIHVKYAGDSKFHGITTGKFHGDLGDMSSNPEDKCYCPTPKTCLKKGVMDLNKCMGVPLYASLPHFLHADESYLNGVTGLNPVVDDHIIRITFEQMTGAPVEAKKRIQFNLHLQPVQQITIMKNVPTVLHPIFWLEESVELRGEFVKLVTNVFLLLKIAAVLKYMVLVASVGGMGYAIFLHFKNKRNNSDETKNRITPEDNKSINKENDENELKSEDGYSNKIPTIEDEEFVKNNQNIKLYNNY